MKELDLNEKEAIILKGEAIINTLFSLLDDDFDYDKKAVKSLINKLRELGEN